jgi:hypothetical protein
MMSPGRIFENRGAAATLLELSVQRLNRAKNPGKRHTCAATQDWFFARAWGLLEWEMPHE